MGRIMLNPPSPVFAPIEKVERFLAKCEELRREFADDPDALADIAHAEDGVRAGPERRRRRAAGE